MHQERNVASPAGTGSEDRTARPDSAPAARYVPRVAQRPGGQQRRIEAVNRTIELHLRLARGFRNHENYQLRKPLAAGGPTLVTDSGCPKSIIAPGQGMGVRRVIDQERVRVSRLAERRSTEIIAHVRRPTTGSSHRPMIHHTFVAVDRSASRHVRTVA